MSNFATIKAELQKLLDMANAKTGKADADLTGAVGSLVDGYGSGGGSGSYYEVDIPANIVAAVEITAEDVEQPVNATHALYNDTRLPVIPQEVLSKFPNVAIIQWIDGGGYGLIAAPSGYEWVYDLEQIRIKTCTFAYYKYNAEIDQWEFRYETSGNGSFNISSITLIWSVNDIMSGSSVYFAGSEPIPVE